MTYEADVFTYRQCKGIQCAVNEYADNGLDCKPCPSGRFSLIGHNNYGDCRCPGATGESYVEGSGYECVSCAAGKFKNTDVSVSGDCLPCPEGQVSDIGSFSCDSCAGTVVSDVCTRCLAGTTYTGPGVCTDCPSNSRTVYDTVYDSIQY